MVLVLSGVVVIDLNVFSVVNGWFVGRILEISGVIMDFLMVWVVIEFKFIIVVVVEEGIVIDFKCEVFVCNLVVIVEFWSIVWRLV